MSEPIGPGDWVECIGGPTFPDNEGKVVVGNLYRVKAMIPKIYCSCGKQHEGLRFHGVLNPHDPKGIDSHWWGICCFRPIYRPRQELIKQLKAPPLNAEGPLRKADA